MILVTGAAGYIGSHCVLKLIQNGYNVVMFDNLENGHIETVKLLEKTKAKGKIVDFIKGDLRNYQDVKNIFKKHEINIVCHFAANIETSESISNPQKYYLNNVLGSLNLFNAMIENNIKKIVFASTAAVYGVPEYTPIDENHRLSPINPYGQSKLMVEKILNDYAKAYDFRSVILRYFNVAGAESTAKIGEWHEPESHLVPNILASIFDKNKIFKLYGQNCETKDNSCIRDYVHIEDVTNANILAVEYLKNNGKAIYINIGTGIGHSTKEVLKVCEETLGEKIQIQLCPKRVGDSDILICDNKKAKTLLNWEPKHSLEEIIASAAKWMKHNKM